MKIYFAASEAGIHRRNLLESGVKNMLASFFYLKDNFPLEELKEKGVSLFLDSGGYSARVSGKDVDIYSYRFFLERNKNYISIAANLDVGDIESQLKNQKILEEVYPILPVYHLSEFLEEKFDILDKYLEQYSYIALGGMVGGGSFSRAKLEHFLNYCFKKGIPKKVKYHGFGITSFTLAIKYPFYSLDSTSWLIGGKFGRMYKWEDYRMKSNIHCLDKKGLADINAHTNLITDYQERDKHNICQFLQMEKDLTKLWVKRGIVWD